MGAPLRTICEPGNLTLVERGPVKPPQAEFVPGEMRRHPVEEHADTPTVELVDHEAQIVGTSVARGGSEVSADLITPRAAERMLHEGEKLDVGETHLLHVVSKLRRQLPVRQTAVSFFRHPAPRARLHLVNRYRRLDRIVAGSCRHPRFVTKLVA